MFVWTNMVLNLKESSASSSVKEFRPRYDGERPHNDIALNSIAVLVPCHNEAATIAKVVQEFRRSLPMALIYVYDNGSTDATAQIAHHCGAIVRVEPMLGKGNVVRRMFADVEADIYVMVDGDCTYDPDAAPVMIERLLQDGLDMVNCARLPSAEGAYRPAHQFGNKALSGLVARVFGRRLRDMLSGYRVMSRRFVKSFPALSTGFEIETEITVHALELRVPIAEITAPYIERPSGSASKLRTIGDGIRILKLIVHLVKEERPLQLFSAIFLALMTTSLALGVPVVMQFLSSGLVYRLPTALLATGLMILAFLNLFCGFVLDTVTRGRRELKRLIYLAAHR
jgi:glycosyltransferase involved in cell wall biosynthesis